MKRILFLLIFFLPYFASAQKKSIDGFMDIPFGSDSATVKAAVLGRGGRQVDSMCKKDELMFSNFSLSQRPVSYLLVKFVNNKAYQAIFSFEHNGNDILESYDDLAHDITAVYGQPVEVDNYPDFTSTDTKLRKIWAKDILIKTLWTSKNKNGIGLQISPIGQSLMLILLYQQSSGAEIENAKRRADL